MATPGIITLEPGLILPPVASGPAGASPPSLPSFVLVEVASEVLWALELAWALEEAGVGLMRGVLDAAGALVGWAL